MRPRILHDLSQRLAILLEEGLRGSSGDPHVPVLLCHPLDALQGRESLGEGFETGPLGVLYPMRIAPRPQLRQAGPAVVGGALEAAASPQDLEVRLRFPALWVGVRYAFLVAGGAIDEQLGAVAAVLRTLHDHPAVAVTGDPEGDAAEPPAARGAPGGEEDDGLGELERGTFPLRIVEQTDAWRELGLPEHSLSVTFEVTVPIPSRRTETFSRVLDRELDIEGNGP